LKHCWEWTENYGGNIQGQVKSMGSSCDWSREKFTLDEDLNKSVTKAFVDLYNK
jgi:valyl-tRNA synthetase